MTKLIISLFLFLLQQQSFASDMCQGINLSYQCGNQKCQEYLGENETSCPLDCKGRKFHSYNYQTICQLTELKLVPNNIKEASSAIKNAKKVKVSGKAHTANGQICSEELLISTEKLKKIEGPFLLKGEEVVKVEAGVTLSELAEYLHKKGKTIGVSHPQYKHLTVVGVMQTGSHGTSLKHNASIETQIRAVEVVLSSGEIKTFYKNETDHNIWKTLTVGLGLYGYVHNLYLTVEKDFNLETTWAEKEENTFLSGNDLNIGEICDVNQLIWFPLSKKLFSWCGKKTDKSITLTGESTFINNNITPLMRPIARYFVHAGRCSSHLGKMAEDMRIKALKDSPPLRYIKGYDRKGKPIYQHTNTLVTATKDVILSYNDDTVPLFSLNDYALSIGPKYRLNALKYLQKKFLENKTALPIFGVNMRFNLINNESHLGLNAQNDNFPIGQYALIIDLIEYQPKNIASESEFKKPMEEIIKTLITEYKARLHWGKNSDELFQFYKKNGAYQENFSQFQSVIKTLDPEEKFKNKFLEEIFQEK